MDNARGATDPIAPLPPRAAQPKPAIPVAAARVVSISGSPVPLAKPAPPKARLAVAGALPPARIPLASLVSPSRRSTIGVAIGVSLALHALAMTLHFTVGSGRIRDREPPLEVALVNAKSASKPTKADLLAQANLDGGGNTEQNRRAKTPLPVLPRETPRQNVAVASSPREVPDNTTHEMLTQLRSSATIATPEP